MRVLVRVKRYALALAILLLLASAVFAKDYIEVWPEGWSEITPLFGTSIFADRFFVVQDDAGTSFLSVDGLYFKELDLTYRLIQEHTVVEEVVLRPRAEIESAFLGADSSHKRYALWIERSPAGNSVNLTTFEVPYEGHESAAMVQTTNAIQDLAAFQMDKTTYVVWSERDTFFQIRYAKIVDGTVVVTETVTGTPDISIRPNIVVDDTGTIHIAWMETTESGVEIRYSRRLDDGWGVPRVVGEGSVQDIQQGGRIAMATFDDEVCLAWSAMPRTSSRLAVFMARVNALGELSVATPVALGTKVQFVTGVQQPEIVWQGVGTFGAQVNYRDQNGDITNLTVGRKGAFRPEAYGQEDFRYVYWLQAEPDGRFVVHGINSEFPKAMSLWRRVGLDEKSPFYHLVFLFMSTFMLAAVYTITNLGVLAAAGVIWALLQRIGAYRRQGVFYQIAILSVLILVVRRLPIPAVSPRFFGIVHHGLSYALATLGTFVILRKVRQKGLFLTIGILILWMVLYSFFALVPQTILR